MRLTPNFKIALRAIFIRTQPRKMPYHSQIFARKPDQLVKATCQIIMSAQL